MEEQIKTIREACIKASYGKDVHPLFLNEASERNVFSLADVLLAIEESRKGFVVGTDGRFWQLIEKDIELTFRAFTHCWNLKDDNIENQTADTITFIHSLLTK